MEYIFEFSDDVAEVWFSFPDDVIYKQSNNSDKLSLVTKKVQLWWYGS